MNKLRKFNVDKMRRHQARSTPDAIWMTIDLMDDDAQDRVKEWQGRWIQMMMIKHAKGNKEILAYETQLLDQPGHIRIQLVVTDGSNRN